jgi:hypothetical protein
MGCGCKLLWCKQFVGRRWVEYLGGDMTVMPAYCGQVSRGAWRVRGQELAADGRGSIQRARSRCHVWKVGGILAVWVSARQDERAGAARSASAGWPPL